MHILDVLPNQQRIGPGGFPSMRPSNTNDIDTKLLGYPEAAQIVVVVAINP